MLKLLIPAAALLLCTQVGTPAGGQTPAPAQSDTTIHATANEVLLDFVVRDKHHKMVKNLKPGDVQLFEDGVPQKILSFRLEEGYSVQAAAAKQPKAPAGPAPQTLRKVNLICIVFHNQDNLDQTMKKLRLEAVQEFLNNQMQPDTWIGVFYLGTRLTVLHPFTTNRADVVRAASTNFTGVGTFQLAKVADAVLSGTPNLDVIEGFANAAGHAGGGTETLQVGKINTAVNAGVNVETGLGADAQRGDLVDQQRSFGAIDGMRQMDQMKTMISELGTLPGHKTILMMSSGLTTTGDPEQFKPILAAANKANLTIYALDTNGLSENSNVQAGTQALQHVASLSGQQSKGASAPADSTGTTGSVGQDAELMRQDDYLHNAVRTSDTQAPLRALSEGTGGFLMANTNDFRKPFQKLVEDVGMHYEAAYHSTAEKYDGRLRRIEVKLARADLTVETRLGYFALPALPGAPSLTPVDVAGLMMLNAQPRPHAFNFRSAAFQFRPEGETSQYAVSYEVPTSSLTVTAQPQLKRHHVPVSVFALVKDSSGQVIDKFSQDAPFEIPDDRMAALAGASIPYTHMLSLPAGRFTVETAVLDREGSRASTSKVVIENPPSKGIGMSSVLLIRQVDAATGKADGADPFRVGSKHVTPDLAATLQAGAKPFVYFVVYPDKSSSAHARIEIQFLIDGQVVARRAEDLPVADEAGAVPKLFGTVAKPGNCELKIIATQGSESLERSVKYTVVAN